MKKKKILAILAVLAIFLSACNAKSQAYKASEDSPPPEDVYLGLRSIWLDTPPEELGVDFEEGSQTPYAVVMDIGLDNGTATIVSSIFGDGSMYTSTGGGIIGGIEHESVRDASIYFVEISASFIGKMELVDKYPLPSPNHVKFYVVTPSGIYTADEADPNLLASGNYELSPLFLAGNDVITALRESTEGN